jgi:hypothetical protein
MFHLFAGVQVMPDVLAFILNREYVLSRFDDYQFDYDYSVIDGILNQPHVCIARASHYLEMVGDGKQYNDDLEFFQDIYAHAHEKPTIYADCQNYAIITAKLLKLLYRDMTSDLAYILYKLSIDKFIAKYCYLDQIAQGFKFIRENNLRKQGVKRLTKAQFVSLYNKTIFFGDDEKVKAFRNMIEQSIGTEFMIANSLLDNNKFDQTLLPLLQNVAADHVRSFCYEYSSHEAFNTLCHQYEKDYDIALKENQPFNLFVNPIISGDKKIKSADEMDAFAEAARQATVYYQQHISVYHWDLEESVTPNYSGEYVDFLWLTEILTKKMTVKEILARELEIRDKGYKGSVLFSYSSHENINLFILFMVYEMYKNKDPMLQQFVI